MSTIEKGQNSNKVANIRFLFAKNKFTLESDHHNFQNEKSPCILVINSSKREGDGESIIEIKRRITIQDIIPSNFTEKSFK